MLNEIKIPREAYTNIVKMFDTLVPDWIACDKGTSKADLVGGSFAAAAQRVTNMARAEVYHEGSGGFFQALLLHPLTQQSIEADHTGRTLPMPRAEGFINSIDVNCSDDELLNWMNDHCRLAVIEGQTESSPQGEHVANEWTIRWPTSDLRQAIQAQISRMDQDDDTGDSEAAVVAAKPKANEPRTAEDKYVEEQNAPWGSGTVLRPKEIDAENEDDEVSALPPQKRSTKTAKVPVPETPTDAIALVLEAWDHGQFSGMYLKKYALFPPVHRALTELLTWLAYNHTALAYTPAIVEPAKPLYPDLNRFYGVESDSELIAAMEHHISKLQAQAARTPPKTMVRRVRQG